VCACLMWPVWSEEEALWHERRRHIQQQTQHNNQGEDPNIDQGCWDVWCVMEGAVWWCLCVCAVCVVGVARLCCPLTLNPTLSVSTDT
jgi:hypothetical protein